MNSNRTVPSRGGTSLGDALVLVGITVLVEMVLVAKAEEDKKARGSERATLDAA